MEIDSTLEDSSQTRQRMRLQTAQLCNGLPVEWTSVEKGMYSNILHRLYEILAHGHFEVIKHFVSLAIWTGNL